MSDDGTSEELLAARAENEALKAKFDQLRSVAQMVLDGDKKKQDEIKQLTEEGEQMRSDIKHLETKLGYRDDELADSERTIAQLHAKIEEGAEVFAKKLAGYKHDLADLRSKLQNKDAEIELVEAAVGKLREALTAKEKECLEMNRIPALNESSFNRSTTDLLAAENGSLKEEISRLKDERDELSERLRNFEFEVHDLQRKLHYEQQMTEEVTELSEGYKLQAEEYKKRIEDLEAELVDVRSDKMSKKGNSMFAEFVDERLKLEKDLLKLKAQNDGLVAYKEVQDREIDNLRQELITALSMRSAGSSDENTLGLQNEIWNLRDELELLKRSGVRVTKEDGESGDVQRTSSVAESRTNLYLQETCVSLREEIRALKKKLSETQRDRANYFDKLSESEHKRKVEVARARQLEIEKKGLETRLRQEELRNNTKKLSKEDKEKMIEKITDVRAGLNVGSSVFSTFDASGPSTSDALTADYSSDHARSLTANNNENTNEESTQSCAVSQQSSPHKRKAGLDSSRSLASQKRLKHVQFNDDVLVHSVTTQGTSKIKPMGRRNARKQQPKVLQADVGAEAPECKQQ